MEQEPTFRATFLFDAKSDVYFKPLATPWSPVNDGTPNGTVEDGVGVSGWWMHFRLLDKDGALLATDADGDPVDADLDDHVGTNGTRRITIAGDTPYQVEVTVHVPAEGAQGHGVYEIPFAIVQARSDSDEDNGASMDPSKGVTLELTRPDGPVSEGTPSTGPSDQESGPSDQEDSGPGIGAFIAEHISVVYIGIGALCMLIGVGITIFVLVHRRNESNAAMQEHSEEE